MSLFKRLFSSSRRHLDTDDDVLGPLRWSEELECWIAASPRPGVTFLIGGGTVPDQALIVHARAIVASFPVFESDVRAFLEREATRFPSALSAEIRALSLESINLFWPERPDDGMLYFEGSEEGRVWRCDYLQRCPRNLGFDS